MENIEISGELENYSARKKVKGWHRRGKLPHFDGGEICQFITFRLFDSMPQNVLERWKLELENEEKEVFEQELRKKIEGYLDSGYGSCFLKNEGVAEIVQNALFHLEGEKFKLIAWVIMPNHIHLLLKPLPNISLTTIMQSIKGFSAYQSNKLLGRKGSFWQKDYFDRYIRHEKHYWATIAYIENNPVKANLCQNAQDWKFGSAKYRLEE